MSKLSKLNRIVCTNKKTTIPATELFSNGGCETWSEGLPTGWLVNLNSGTIEQSTDKKSGTYAIKAISAEPPTGGPQDFGYGVTGRTAGELLDVSVWVKMDATEPGPPDGEVMVFIYNNAYASATHKWNGSAWVALSGSGLNPDDDFQTLTEPATYTQVSDTLIPVPASGNLYVYVQFLGPGAVGYIDDLSIKTQETKSNVNYLDIVIADDKTDMTSSDTVLRVLDKDGDAVGYIRLDTFVNVKPE